MAMALPIDGVENQLKLVDKHVKAYDAHPVIKLLILPDLFFVSLLPYVDRMYFPPESKLKLADLLNSGEIGQKSDYVLADELYKLTGLKVEHSTIFQWRRGKSIPSLYHGSFLVELLKCSGDELLGVRKSQLPPTLTVKLFRAVTNAGVITGKSLRNMGRMIQFIPGFQSVATWFYTIADVVDECNIWINSDFNNVEKYLPKTSQLSLL